MDERRFDALAKDMASGRVTRRQGLKVLMVSMAGAAVQASPLANLVPAAAAATNPCSASCTTNILFEGTCQQFVNTLRCCCDANGLTRTASNSCPPGVGAPDTSPAQVLCCKSGRYQPLFTCDATCANARARPCNDNDLWLVLPRSMFTRAQCGQQYTICANGRQVQVPVRDRSDANDNYEVSLGVLKALGLPTGSFRGKIYPPGTPQQTISNDTCCHCCSNPAVCGGYVLGCGGNSNCACGIPSEGGSACFADTSCRDIPSCSSSAQCGAGSLCFPNTCCGAGGVCLRVCAAVSRTSSTSSMTLGADGPTAAGR
jgi:hypothetical protein